MPIGDRCWVDYSEDLRKQMFNVGKSELTISMEEIHAKSRTTVPFAELRNPGYWNACRNATQDWDTFQKNGIELDFDVEADGKVHVVTFRLDERRRGTLERMLQRRANDAS